ncbi:hypothetical protein BPOR_0288g00080 [Botrytis porri]|uniref:Uncharacterized protein n=1 Tax=Botrytis porri TaxID=87229 RepID=A0A4Z1KQ67_9HELO|nr:hypothetical protein BPOR_0288g00080 [Botrytis porri]
MKTQTILSILLATAHLAVAQEPIREPEAEVAGDRFPVPATKETTIAQAFGSSNSGANQQAICQCYDDDGTNSPSLTAATSQEQGANSDSGTSFTHIVDTTPPKRPWKRQGGGQVTDQESPEAPSAAGGWKPKPKPSKPEEAAASASVDATQVGINAAGGAGSASGSWGAVSYAGPSIGANYQDIDGNCVCPPGKSPHKPKGPTEGGATGPSTGGPSTGGPSGGGPSGGGRPGGNGNGSGNGNGNCNGNGNGNGNENENLNENENENLNANINKNENVNINGNANANINKNLGLNFGSNNNGWGSWFGSKAAAAAADPAASGTPVAASDASGVVGATDALFVPELSTGDASGVEQFTGAGSSIVISAWGFLAAVFAIANVL